MPVQIKCLSCQKLLQVPDGSQGKNFRCPKCNNISPIPDTSISPARPPIPPPAPAPNYFHAVAVYRIGAKRLYRVYILPEELVFIYAGSGEDHAAKFATYGAAGALVAGFFERWSKPEIKNQKRLEQLDHAELEDLSGDHKHNFRVFTSELSDVAIDPPSSWDTYAHLGIFRFKHTQKGKMRLYLRTLEDVKTAAEKLHGVMANQVSVNVEPDRPTEATDRIKKHRSWLLYAFLGLMFGIAFFFSAQEKQDLRTIASVPAKELSLKQLLASGPGTIRHVKVVDFAFGPGYAMETGRFGGWNYVWIPLYAADDARPRKEIKLVVKSGNRRTIGTHIGAEKGPTWKGEINPGGRGVVP